MSKDLIQELRDDPLINQEWLEKILDGESACKSRCFWCILWNKNDCIPKNQYLQVETALITGVFNSSPLSKTVVFLFFYFWGLVFPSIQNAFALQIMQIQTIWYEIDDSYRDVQ